MKHTTEVNVELKTAFAHLIVSVEETRRSCSNCFAWSFALVAVGYLVSHLGKAPFERLCSYSFQIPSIIVQ